MWQWLIDFFPPGGILTGALSDLVGARAVSCVIMMYFAVPTVSYWDLRG